MTELKGKKYKIVVNLVVAPNVGESPLADGESPVCPPPKLHKFNGKSITDSFGYNLNSITVTFADLDTKESLNKSVRPETVEGYAS